MALIFVSGVAHFFMGVGGSKIHERLAHFFIDIYMEDVAEHLSISQDTVRTWIKEGKLPVYRAGKRYKFKISEVDEWVRKGKIQD